MKTLTVERLRALLDYDPLTGVFRWRVNRGRVRAGAVAGHTKRDGYTEIIIDYRKRPAHTLAWFYVLGEYPNMLDHINGVRDDKSHCQLTTGDHEPE